MSYTIFFFLFHFSSCSLTFYRQLSSILFKFKILLISFVIQPLFEDLFRFLAAEFFLLLFFYETLLLLDHPNLFLFIYIFFCIDPLVKIHIINLFLPFDMFYFNWFQFLLWLILAFYVIKKVILAEVY